MLDHITILPMIDDVETWLREKENCTMLIHELHKAIVERESDAQWESNRDRRNEMIHDPDTDILY